MKMRATLIQQGLAAVLTSGEKGTKEKKDLDEKGILKREEMLAKAHSAVILCLGDKVLREVAKETTAAGILEKLECLYMTKSLANRLDMKQRLYSYRFSEEKGVIEQLEDFNKAVDDLENIDVSIGDEYKAILLLNELPKSYDQLRDVIMYGRDRTITLLEVQSALRAKELQKGGQGGNEQLPESLKVKKFNEKKGYRLWCIEPGNPKIIISRDVVFLETDMPFKKGSENSGEVEQKSQKSTTDLEVEHVNTDLENEERPSDGSDEDQSVSEEVHDDLRDYQLARD